MKTKSKNCPECRTPMTFKKTTLHFERGNFYADVENVSAYVCPCCGTRSIPGNIALNVSRTVEQLFKSASKSKPLSFTGISFQRVSP